MSNQRKYSELGLKLKNAREAIGISTRHAVTLLPKNITISHVTLTNYEAGRHQAPLDILAGIEQFMLKERIDNLTELIGTARR